MPWVDIEIDDHLQFFCEELSTSSETYESVTLDSLRKMKDILGYDFYMYNEKDSNGIDYYISLAMKVETETNCRLGICMVSGSIDPILLAAICENKICTELSNVGVTDFYAVIDNTYNEDVQGFLESSRHLECFLSESPRGEHHTTLRFKVI